MLPATQISQENPSSASAANAVQHGLAATKYLPAKILHRTEEIFERIAAEQSPKTEIERLLQMDCARRFATLEFAHQCEVSALNVGGRNAQQVAEATALRVAEDVVVEANGDDFLAAAIGSDFLEKLIRYRRGHENGLGRALSFLAMISAKRVKQESRGLTGEECRQLFPDSESCVQYLTERIAMAEWQCPRCESRSGRHWLNARQRWECADCGVQIGLRHGTVMEKSPIPYQKWFWAILLLASNSETSSPQIAEVLGLGRMATAKRIRDTIMAAMHSSKSLELLMGLPALAVRMAETPESNVGSERILQNEHSLLARSCIPANSEVT